MKLEYRISFGISCDEYSHQENQIPQQTPPPPPPMKEIQFCWGVIANCMAFLSTAISGPAEQSPPPPLPSHNC